MLEECPAIDDDAPNGADEAPPLGPPKAVIVDDVVPLGADPNGVAATGALKAEAEAVGVVCDGGAPNEAGVVPKPGAVVGVLPKVVDEGAPKAAGAAAIVAAVDGAEEEGAAKPVPPPGAAAAPKE